MEIQNSDSFQLITEQDIVALKQDNQALKSGQTKQASSVYPSLDDYQNGTISLKINGDDDELMEPVRKSSITFEGWKKEDEHQLQEVSVEQLTKTISVNKEEQPYQFQKNNKEFNESLFTDRKIHHIKQVKQKQLQQRVDLPKQQEYKFDENAVKSKISQRRSSFIVIDHKKVVKIVEYNGKFIWESDFSVQVNQRTIKMLYDEMLSRECFIPLFNIQLYKEWASLPFKQKYQSQNHKYKIFKGYLERYTLYLNENKFYKPFCNVLKKIKENQEHGLETKLKDRSFFNFNFHSLIDSFKKMISQPKLQLLKKTILSKINSLEISIKDCRKFNMKKEELSLSQKLEYHWQILSSLNFLITLQTTREYCLKKCQNHTENVLKTYWINYNSEIKNTISSVVKDELEYVMI